MSNATPLAAEIKEFIMSEFLPDEDPAELTDDTELLTTGILDSLATIKLVVFLETTFNVEVEPHEVDSENLNRISDMVAFVAKKQAAS